MYLADRASRPSTRSTKGGRVATTVVMLGLVSMVTDISSESVTAILPLYLTATLGLSPLAYGFVDGIYQGISALVRVAAGQLADRWDRPKWVAFLGYGLSGVARLALLLSQGLAAVTTVLTVDRLGKGIRTAPRDAMIAASAPADALGRNFGIHRALDTLGALLGPLLAFGVLQVVPGDYRSVFVASLAFAVIGLALLGIAVPDLRPRRDDGLASPAPRHPACLVRCKDCAFADAMAEAKQDEAHPRPSMSLLGTPGLFRIVLVAGVLGLLTIGDGFLYLILARRSELAITYFPLLAVGSNAAYLAMSIPLGRLSDRWGRARVYVLGHLPLAAAFGCALLPGNGGSVVAALALLGIYYAATDGVVAALSSTAVPVSRRASGIASVQTVVALARFISSLGFGLLWTLVGPTSALAGVVVALLVALPPAWRMLRPLDHPTTSEQASR
jgi:MFS family permease